VVIGWDVPEKSTAFKRLSLTEARLSSLEPHEWLTTGCQVTRSFDRFISRHTVHKSADAMKPPFTYLHSIGRRKRHPQDF
jgi:hypothetical protein